MWLTLDDVVSLHVTAQYATGKHVSDMITSFPDTVEQIIVSPC